MASETDPVWFMLQPVVNQNRSLAGLQKNFKLRLDGLCKRHFTHTSQARQKRALRYLETVHTSTNRPVFVACVLKGYTVLADAKYTTDSLLSWYKAQQNEPFIQLALEVYNKSTEEVGNLLRLAKELGASGASARTQVRASSASAHEHTDTQPELPQHFNTSSTPPQMQPQIGLGQSVSTSGASAHAHTDTQPGLPQDLNTLSSEYTQSQIDLGQNPLASGASAHAHTDTQPGLPQDLDTLSTKYTQSQIDLEQNPVASGASAQAHADTQPDLPQHFNTLSSEYTQSQIDLGQNRGASSASAHAHTDTQPGLPQDLNTLSSEYTQSQIGLGQNRGASSASAHAHTDTQPGLPQDLNTLSSEYTQSQIDLGQTRGASGASAHEHTNPQPWATQIPSLDPSVSVIPGNIFLALVQSFLREQLIAEAFFEGVHMRGIVFRFNNVPVGYWEMSVDFASYAQGTLVFLS
jgi:hypothetical protein